MRRVLFLAVLLGAGILLALWIRQRNSPDEVAAMHQLPAPHVVQLNDLLTYTSSVAPAAAVETQRDVFPGGVMAAMVPGIVRWQQSSPEEGHGSIVMANINEGGNPLGGYTALRTAWIPLSSLLGAEFILVPLDPLGKRGVVSHGQIRFLFDLENPVRILNVDGEPDESMAPVEDLVFSWEAWRAPGADYDVMVGMEAGAYELSLRVFTGRQRFLEDTLGSRSWFSTPLTLPGGQRGLLELLRVCVVMGDSMGRSTISRLLNEAKDDWVAAGGPTEADATDLLAEWNELKRRVDQGIPVDDVRMRLEGDTDSYQSLIRSCATMALYTINVATERLKQMDIEGASEVSVVPMPSVEEIPDWMTELADVNLMGVFLRAPHALKYIHNNKAVIPSHIPGMLAEAGLGASLDGKVVQTHYEAGKRSPYGSAGLIR